jgi:hypothetical protein
MKSGGANTLSAAIQHFEKIFYILHHCTASIFCPGIEAGSTLSKIFLLK